MSWHSFVLGAQVLCKAAWLVLWLLAVVTSLMVIRAAGEVMVLPALAALAGAVGFCWEMRSLLQHDTPAEPEQ